MNFDEYTTNGRLLYQEFAGAVAAILDAALRADKAIKLQAIQKRAKRPAEVQKKLQGKESDIENTVKDLAGVRLVVYTNGDVARLNDSGILFRNFEIIWERTKFHFPQSAGDGEKSHFIGRNYVVRLKADRLALPEYERFKGLQCEVQVQTILDHAWSETAHDTIYKSPNLNDVGAAQMATIKGRMNDIQQRYLIPAGHMFEKVLRDFNLIVTGHRLASTDILAQIRDAADNNVRVELLEQYATNVLPILDDKVGSASEIRSALVHAVRNCSATAIVPIKTTIGEVSGRTLGDVVEATTKILAALRYVEPAKAYEAYAELYILLRDKKLKAVILSCVGELAQHTTDVWERVGPAVQEILLQTIKTASPDLLSATRPVMIEVAKKCLEPDMTGTTGTSSAIIWKSGSVVMSAQMGAVRDQALDILFDLFRSSQKLQERRRIYSAMQTATRLPAQGRYSDLLLSRVLIDTSNVTNFVVEHAHSLDPLLKQSIERHTLFQYRRARGMPADMLKDDGVRAARDAVIAAAIALREQFNASSEYVIFKTLVGFESVFGYEWDDDEGAVDFTAKDKFRKERAAEYLEQVTEHTAAAWFDRLNTFATIESNDLAMFPMLGAFIADIAEKLPTVGASWLAKSRNEPIAQFKPGMLRGLYASDKDAALSWIRKAISHGEDLSDIALFIRHCKLALPEFLEMIANAGISAKDEAAVYMVLEACAYRPDEFGMPLARKLAIQMLSFLNNRRYFNWINPLSLWGKRHGLLLRFDETERRAVLSAMCDLPRIDYHAEEILAVFSEEHAAEVVDFFGARLTRKRLNRENDLDVGRYEAIPFSFSRLHHSLQNSGPILLPKALEWHGADPILGKYGAAKLVANVFPTPPADVAQQLVRYAGSGDPRVQHFVIDVMSNYKGVDMVFDVLREVVATQPECDDLASQVRSALWATGVMHGEFGYRDALIAERNRLMGWLSDERKPVREFAVTSIKSLDNQIAVAQQAAEADIAGRKLDYGEELDTKEPKN